MKLLGQILFFTLVPLIVVLGNNYYQALQQKNIMQKQIDDDTKRIKKDIKLNLEKKLDTVKQISTLLSKSDEVIKAVEQRDTDLLFRKSKRFINSGLISNTLFIDKKGFVVCRGLDEYRFNDSIKGYPIFKVLEKEKKFSGFLKIDGIYQYASFRPVYKYDVIFIGYVMVSHLINREFLVSLSEQDIFLQFRSDKTFIDNFTPGFKNKQNLYTYTPLVLEGDHLEKTGIPRIVIYNNDFEKKELISKYQFEQSMLIVSMLVIFTLFVVIFVNKTLKPLNIFNKNLLEFTNKRLSLDELIKRTEDSKYSKNELREIEDSVLKALKTLKQTQKELIVSKQEAQKANRIKSEFMSNISHEIRTPMNAIIGFTNVLLKNTYYNENQKNYLETIKTSAVSLTAIIDDILDFSRIEAGRMMIEKEYRYITDIFKELRSNFEEQIEQKELDFIINIDKTANSCRFKIDGGRLKQVLKIIIENSIKFTKEGFIKLSFTIEKIDNLQADIKISIQDSGMGIDKSKQQVIFESFTRIYDKDDISHIHSGTGLGLAISKKLIDLMEGEVSVESEVDKGSTFNIHFKKLNYKEH